mgnify:CR=1 FL=1
MEVPLEIKEKRLNICKNCEHVKITMGVIVCKKCNCIMKAKTRFARSKCPIGKWNEYSRV